MEKLQFVSSLLVVDCHTKASGLWQDYVSASSTNFDVGFLLFIQCVGVAQLVSGFLLEEIIPYVAVHFECLWVGGEVESLLCHHSGSETLTVFYTSLSIFYRHVPFICGSPLFKLQLAKAWSTDTFS